MITAKKAHEIAKGYSGECFMNEILSDIEDQIKKWSAKGSFQIPYDFPYSRDERWVTPRSHKRAVVRRLRKSGFKVRTWFIGNADIVIEWYDAEEKQ